MPPISVPDRIGYYLGLIKSIYERMRIQLAAGVPPGRVAKSRRDYTHDTNAYLIAIRSATFGQYLRIPNLCLVAGLDCVVVMAGSFCRRSADSFRLMVTGSTGVPKEWPSSSTKLWIVTRRSLPSSKATRIKELSVPSLQMPKPCWK
jgi:hypothetical protein